MTWLKGLAALIQTLLKALGMIERHQERQTGAAIQKGADDAKELERVTRAIDAGNSVDPDGMRDDPFNRDNQRR